MKISATVTEVTLEGDYSNEIQGIELECSRCGHSVEVFGTSDASEKRGCKMLNEECPKGENNFYEADWI